MIAEQTEKQARPDIAGAPSESVARVKGLAKTYQREDGTDVLAIAQVSLDVQPGEFMVFLGPSGCGKTTLLRSIAGLENCDSGTIEIHGKSVFDATNRLNIPPEHRQVSMVFQSYALWPHMSVFENVAYPLRSRGVRESEVGDRVREVLELVNILELEKQYPSQMSGGQQQRVALARALVMGDKLVLFDEPLSNVDAKVRDQLRVELLEMQQKLNFAALYVTHDQGEALALAHRIAVMREGEVAQLGPPHAIYNQPDSLYVARFIGSTNELSGKMTTLSQAGQASVSTALGDVVATSIADTCKQGDDVAIVFRPERCVLSHDEPEGPNTWKVKIDASLFLGSHVEYLVKIDEQTFQIWHLGEEEFVTGSEIWLSVQPQHVRVVPTDEQ